MPPNVEAVPFAGLLLHCRAGFEKECAAEIVEQALVAGVQGYVKTRPDSAWALFLPHEPAELASFRQALRFDTLIFARQIAWVAPLLQDLPAADRIQPLLAAVESLAGAVKRKNSLPPGPGREPERSDRRARVMEDSSDGLALTPTPLPRGEGLAAAPFGTLFVETADTNEAKELSVFLRKFEAPLRRALIGAGLLQEAGAADRPALHLFFLDSSTVYVGLSDPDNASRWPMGIPRLKFPSSAPSRSTLKLDEAFLSFIGDPEHELQPAMRAVDLGAAPGGWTWQLVKRSLRVTAVDNGPMDSRLLESGIVEHLRQDGFRYRPAKPVDWMVCDIVEQPIRIAKLVADWCAGGHCRSCIFNLKLPMKKRYDEVRRCRTLIEDALNATGCRYVLRFRQLYHDREEVTGYLSIR